MSHRNNSRLKREARPKSHLYPRSPLSIVFEYVSWGSGGFFYILRGANLCGIEDYGLKMPMTYDYNLALKSLHSTPAAKNNSSPDTMAGGWMSADVKTSMVAAAFSQLADLTAAQGAPPNTTFATVLNAHTQVVEGLNLRLLVQHADSDQRSEHVLHRPLGSRSHLLVSSNYQ